MSAFAVITPSYGPDFELCRDLHSSLLSCTPDEVVHHIIVPPTDQALFAQLADDRTKVWPESALIPRRMVALPGANAWINVRSPVPPIRGWVMQQVLKLAAAARIESDLLLIVDSDVRFVRPVVEETFRVSGRSHFYRRVGGVTAGMSRHLRWHAVARSLLGLPQAPPPPLSDYVSSFNVWDRRVVLALLNRMERVTGRPWQDAIARQLHVSEFILYGVFVDEVLKESAQVVATQQSLCHSYWGTTPLDADAAAAFVSSLPESDVAIMISAKSHTPLNVRRAALSNVQ